MFSRRILGLVVIALSSAACTAAPTDEVGSSEGAATEDAPEPTDLTPAYWDVDADPKSPTPGSEPLNVIITTNVPMEEIVEALGAPVGFEDSSAWQPVVIGVGFDFVSTGGKACISAEKANIDGPKGAAGNVPQAVSLRVAGCLGVVREGESHARAWESVKRRKGDQSTWYLALSQEHVCTVDVNGSKKAWHCILPNGFVGDSVSAPTGGYNKGREDFVADLTVAGRVRGWKVDCKSIDRPAGSGLHVPNVAPVTWDAHATHCSAMRPPPSP
ncbi:MAG TPA: hypothetical protein VLT33_23380 [Labilithrix sp.]|nr:hypothetical protein [Labilithrix sp.]